MALCKAWQTQEQKLAHKDSAQSLNHEAVWTILIGGSGALLTVQIDMFVCDSRCYRTSLQGPR